MVLMQPPVGGGVHGVGLNRCAVDQFRLAKLLCDASLVVLL